MMATDVSVADIIKPTNDKRDYRCFFLPNSLNCMVISDPQTTKMAASLSIAIGYFADPDGLHGMADLLNRTLLYGNRHYKDFLHHMNQNDGCIKSQTSAERTSFSFNANSGFLRSALVRFGKFFVEPALVCTDASLEDLQCDSHHEEKNKLNQLQRYLTSKDHPYHKFHPENWKKVKCYADKMHLNLSQKLQSFYESSYSANAMAFVVYGKESLDELQSMVKSNFQDIRNKEVAPFQFLRHPCNEDSTKILVKVEAKEGHSLILQWPIVCSIRKRGEADSCLYLEHVFCLSGEGSLVDALKQLGWSDGLECKNDRYSEFSLFAVHIQLTSDGQDHFKEICGLVFNYIKMLKKEKPRKSIFDQLRASSMKIFNSGVVSSSIEHIDNISANMLVFPPDNWLRGSMVPLTYNVGAISKIVTLLSPENVRIFLESDKFEGRDIFDGMRYFLEPVPVSVIKDWMADSPKMNMRLPAKASKKAPACPNLQAVPTSPKLQSVPLMKTEEISETVGKVCIIYDKRMLKHKPSTVESEHKPSTVESEEIPVPIRAIYEIPDRISAIYEKLEEDQLLDRCTVYESDIVQLKYVLDVHEDDYLVHIANDKDDKNVGDMYFGDGSWDAIRLAAGAVVKACQKVVTKEHPNAFAVVRPPGHHAKISEEGGFCYFNNIAIGARYLMREHGAKRIFILDWDIHFGDGTEEIFRKDNNVFVVSMHRDSHFPLCGATRRVKQLASASNIGLNNGKGYHANLCWTKARIGDDDLYAVFDCLIIPLILEFNPDMILLSAGFDAAMGDLLGDCSLTHVGYATALNKLMELKIGLVMVLEGGYNLEVTAQCCSSCVRVLSGDKTVVHHSNEYFPLPSTMDAILELRKQLNCWECFKHGIPEEILARIRPINRRPPRTKDGP